MLAAVFCYVPPYRPGFVIGFKGFGGFKFIDRFPIGRYSQLLNLFLE